MKMAGSLSWIEREKSPSIQARSSRAKSKCGKSQSQLHSPPPHPNTPTILAAPNLVCSSLNMVRTQRASRVSPGGLRGKCSQPGYLGLRSPKPPGSAFRTGPHVGPLAQRRWVARPEEVRVRHVVLSAGIQKAAIHCWAFHIVRDHRRFSLNPLRLPLLRQIKKFHIMCP